MIWVNFYSLKVERCSFQLHKFLWIFNIIITFFDIEEIDVLTTLWHEKVWTTVVMKLLYIFFILGIPWGLVWTGRRREGGGRGDHQTVWGAVLQELRLVQNPGPSHQQRLPHGIHYSIERGKLLMENNFFSKATSTGISLSVKNWVQLWYVINVQQNGPCISHRKSWKLRFSSPS